MTNFLSRRAAGHHFLLPAVGLLLLFAAHGCGLWKDDKANARKGASAVSCTLTTQERAALTQLVIQPVPCSATALCPRGSFCDQEQNNTCNWHCLSDSDCGTGVCTCDGICSDSAPPPPDGGTASCGKSATLLAAIKVPETQRRCEWDDTCPLGSFCNRGKGICDWNCLDPSTPCAMGQTCDCLGKCVSPTTPKKRPMARLPELQLGGLAIEITGDPANPPLGWERTLEIRLTTKDTDMLEGTDPFFSYVGAIHIEPGNKLEVACLDPNIGAPWTTGCDAIGEDFSSSWSFNKVNDHWEASKTIWIRPRASGPAPEHPNWDIRFYSERVSRVPQTMGVQFGEGATQPTTWAALTPALGKKYYEGVVELTPDNEFETGGGGSASIPGSASGAAEGMRIPVKAYYDPTCLAGAGCLVLVDETSILSAGKAITVSTTGQETSTDWNAPDMKGVFGVVVAQIHPELIRRHNRTGAVLGTFTMRVSTDWVYWGEDVLHAQVTLSPVDPIAGLPECGGGGACASDQTCVSNAVCVPYRSGTLFHASSNDWLNYTNEAAEFAASEVGTPGNGVIEVPAWSYVFAGSSGTPRFPPFAPAAISRTIASGSMDVELCSEVLTDAFATSTYSLFTRSLIGGCTSTACFCTAARIPDGTIPCIDNSSGLAPGGPLTSLETQPFCDRIRPDYLTACSLSDTQYRFLLTDPIVDRQLPIRFCPDWAKTDLDRALPWNDGCSTLDTSGAPSMGAHDVGRALSFSGDYGCAPPAAVPPTPMFGVDLLGYRDLYPAGQGLTDTQLYAECLVDLRRPLPVWLPVSQEPGFSAAVFKNLAATFQPGKCFSPGHFFASVGDLNAYWQLPQRATHQTRSFYVRRLQQWAELHTFIAQQGLELHNLAGVEANAALLGPQQTSTKEPAQIDDVIQQVLAGWAFIASQAASKDDRTLALPVSVLQAPEYRSITTVLGETNKENHEQTMGLPPALMEGAVAMLRLVEKYLDEAQLRIHSGASGTDGTTRSRAIKNGSEAVRMAVTLEDMSAWMYRVAFGWGGVSSVSVACSNDAGCAQFSPAKCDLGVCRHSAWTSRWARARTDYLAVRRAVTDRLVALTQNQNPLGVADQDLPLFFGDLTGTNSRFFASSDYLLNGWAINAVTSAQGALQTARQAWLEKRDSSIRDTLQAADQDRRMEQINSQAGSMIAANCGLDPSIDAASIVEKVTRGELRLDGCYLKQSDPACAATTVLSPTAAQRQAAEQACYQAKEAGNIAPLLQATGFFRNPCHVWFETPPDPSDQRDVISGYSQLVTCDKDGEYYSSGVSHLCRQGKVLCVNGKCPKIPDALVEMKSCDQTGNQFYWSGKTWDECLPVCAAGTCYFPAVFTSYVYKLECPSGRNCQPAYAKANTCTRVQYLTDRQGAVSRLPVANWQQNGWRKECADDLGQAEDRKLTGPERPFSCYMGNMGVAALRALAAAQDVDIADFQFRDAKQVYEIQGRACARRAMGEEVKNANEAQFLSEVRELSAARDALSLVAGISSSIAKGIANPSGAVYELATAGLSAAAQSMETKIQNARDQHAAFLQKVAGEEVVASCFDELEKMRVQFGTLQALITRRTTDVVSAAAELENLARVNGRVFEDARSAVHREEGRTAESWSFHYWIDEKIERFQREFTWAKKLVYLSMRAVEYEFQQSLNLRVQILTATHPDQLEKAVRSLQQEVGTRAINRRRPSESNMVVSLRDDVLGIEDRRAAAVGERAYSASETIRSRLWDERYAVYDKNGLWMGQGVPFTLAPRGIQETRCGERLWRAAATIQGDGLSDSQPGTSVLLLKRNTFQSQWCSGLGDGTPYQSGSIQPSNALFRVDQRELPKQDVSAYSTAQLYPWFNVRRSEFYKTQYQDGASEELAGRGLYGDYVLLFPSQMLLGGRSPVLPPEGGTQPLKSELEKFPLDHVEDVLLRFDYLSVDNLNPLGP